MQNKDKVPRNPLYSAVRAQADPPQRRRHRAIRFTVVLAVLAAAFTVLAILVSGKAYFPIDLVITRSIQSLKSPFLSAMMAAVSWVGFTPQSFLFALGAAILLFVLGLRWEAVVSLLACSTEELMNLLLKTLIHRPRPAADLVQVVQTLSGYSFPSGHVMFYVCLFGFLCFLSYSLLKPSWKRWLLCAVTASQVLLIGISRIYLGEHWASDVLGAYLIASILLFLVIQFYRWGKGRFFANQPSLRGRRS